MNLQDLTPLPTSTDIVNQIESQYGIKYNLDKFGTEECQKLIKETDNLITKFKSTHNLAESHTNPKYTKMLMVKEAAIKRLNELSEQKRLQEQNMKRDYLAALKIVAQGGTLSEHQLKSLKVNKSLLKVLESKEKSLTFIKRIIESKSSPKRALNESEIDQAQTTLAAQDIADQIQDMIAKFADIRYKELPALQDSIRNSQGTEVAEKFSNTVLQTLENLTDNLEDAKNGINNAIGILTGEETGSGLDFDVDNPEGEDEEDLDLDLDFDEEPEDEGDTGEDLDLGDEDEDIEDLGRERR